MNIDKIFKLTIKGDLPLNGHSQTEAAGTVARLAENLEELLETELYCELNDLEVKVEEIEQA